MTVDAEPRIVVRGASKSFDTDRGPLAVLDGVDLTVASGEFVSVLGPSGCGKSTLFSLLTGIERAGSGELIVDGEPPRRRGGPLAWMPQHHALLPWRTVEENIALGLEIAGTGRRAARRRARELVPVFGLDGFGHVHPHHLSGGMRQRAAFARTVATGKDVLLLDEPFGALDALTRTQLQLWLERIWEENRWTVVLITHDVREAVLLSDRVVVLGPRPATVRLEVAVDLPRPRTLDLLLDPRAGALERQLLDALDVNGQG